jgi:hypothetical protein
LFWAGRLAVEITNVKPQLAYAKSQIEWAKKNKETWEEAKAEVDKIDESLH